MIRTIFKLNVLIAVSVMWPSAVVGAFLSNTAVTHSQFDATFDIGAPVNELLTSQFRFLGSGGESGIVRSQVFKGKTGVNDDVFAYLYQIQAPSRDPVDDASFRFASTTLAKVAGVNRTSIYINQGVDADTSIGGLTILGTLAPFNVFDSSPGILLTYSRLTGKGRPIPKAGNGYIVGLFSTAKPTTDWMILSSTTTPDPTRAMIYTPVPVPSSLFLLGFGMSYLIVIGTRRVFIGGRI